MRVHKQGQTERRLLALFTVAAVVVICFGLWGGLYLAAKVVLELAG